MKKALFNNGDRVKYIGSRINSTEVGGKQVPTMFKGMEVTISETRNPLKGYGFIKNDEDGEPIIDHDMDGHNIFINAAGQGRIIWPEKKEEWELIK